MLILNHSLPNHRGDAVNGELPSIIQYAKVNNVFYLVTKDCELVKITLPYSVIFFIPGSLGYI